MTAPRRQPGSAPAHDRRAGGRVAAAPAASRARRDRIRADLAAARRTTPCGREVDDWVDDVQPTERRRRADRRAVAERCAGDDAAERRTARSRRRVVRRRRSRAPRSWSSCAAPTTTGPTLPDAAWLADDDVPPLVRNNLRLYYARWLAQYGLYDEVLAELDGLAPADVVDPASLLFYRMVAHQQLVQPDEARAALVQLMEHKDELPQRFQQVAQLVERDLAALDDESLDHIARRMNDIRRRLAYGRAGAQVQAIERGVVESLDRKIERARKATAATAEPTIARPAAQMQPSQPMEDSRLAELKAPMQVDQRDIGHRSGWGDLPPQEREQALQQSAATSPPTTGTSSNSTSVN